MKRRMLSMFLAIVMVLGLLPSAAITAWAAEGEAAAAEITGMSLTVDGTEYKSGNVTMTSKSEAFITVWGTNFANLSTDNLVRYCPMVIDYYGDTWNVDTTNNTATIRVKNDRLGTCVNYELRYGNKGEETGSSGI